MIKKILKFKTILAFLVMFLPLLALAVTQKEMEQARTIAAKAYIRYANDGSGYLDDLNPKTMEELEASLKPKEKENIKAFKAIPVPTDYKDWNKEKLVEYWAVTAFQNKGLLEKGRGGRLRARSQINKMTIAPPQAEGGGTSSPTTPVAHVQPSDTASSQNNLTSLDSLGSMAASPILENDDNLDEELNVEKATNYTWVYIMVLGILVAIVVALVVYAANVMKKTGNQSSNEAYHQKEDLDKLEHYESLVADKDVEISMLKKKLEAATKQNSELKTKLDAMASEIGALKAASKAEPSPRRPESKETPSNRPVLRTIFLGRANARGIFVRADRTLNAGHSVFVLDTSDGFTGTFRVADSPAAWSLALSNPEEYLETACTGHDLYDTYDVSRIITETSGTAVFEGGCWKVIRKAKIRYEE
ncbi:MAG: hypothetical protein J1F67_09420 [Muribaculaceae bacterium]|nr:hypothetical protein [Muribaculaceae bacterium]